jgi:hypothetical protein
VWGASKICYTSDMKFLLILFLGISILVGAIILNLISSKIGIMNWFEFIKSPNEANFISYIWLFFLYPLGLGIIAYSISKLLN